MSEEEIIDEIKYNILNDPFAVFSQDSSYEDVQIKAKAIEGLLYLYIRAKERNKDLNFENQSLFESIDCNDDNMLARRYQNNKIEIKKLKEENEILKDIFNQIRDLTSPYIVWFDLRTKCYNLKGCNKQKIYRNFSRIREIVYGNYCFIDNDEALKKLIDDKFKGER